MCAYCGLNPPRGRIGTDAADAAGNAFELKTTTGGSVSTARDVGLHTIAVWRSKYWIIGFGTNFRGGFLYRGFWIAHPSDLEPWFGDIENRLTRDAEAGTQVLKAASESGVPKEVLTRVNYLIKRGSTINNPHIPMKLVRERATPIPPNDPESARRTILRFIEGHPLGKATTAAKRAVSDPPAVSRIRSRRAGTGRERPS